MFKRRIKKKKHTANRIERYSCKRKQEEKKEEKRVRKI